MLIEQIIEFELWLYMFSNNWLFLSQKSLRKIFEWIIIYCWNIAWGNVPYFQLPGPNPLQNLIPKCKILNVLWT